MPVSDAVTDRLARESEAYRRLLDKHRSLDERLEKLNARHLLSDEEKVEAITSKKKKLALKDRMAEIAREFTDAAPRGVGN